MRHTPGPWQTSGDTYTDAIEIWSSLPDGRKAFLLADLPNDSDDDQDRQQVEANARLIAKAPEMRAQLAAVLLIIDTNGNDREHCDSDRATELDLDAFDAVVARMSYIRALLAEIDGQ